jgi:hypothetical protein
MENPFKHIALKLLVNETHVELGEDFQRIIEKHNPTRKGLSPLFDKYQIVADAERDVLDIMVSSPLTPDIKKQDHRRNSIFRGFVHAVQSFLNHYDINKGKAALLAIGVLHHYGNVTKKSLDAETAAIDDLLREFEQSENANAINVLNLNEWLVQLKNANDTFRSLMLSRYEQKAQLPLIRMREARKETDYYFRLILKQIEVFSVTNTTEDYQSLIKELNSIFERYRNILAQQKGRRKEEYGNNKKDSEIE